MASIRELNKSITEMEGEEATIFIHAIRERRFKKDNVTGEAKKKKEAKKEAAPKKAAKTASASTTKAKAAPKKAAKKA